MLLNVDYFLWVLVWLFCVKIKLNTDDVEKFVEKKKGFSGEKTQCEVS